ncbi:hypothetical protein TeGR_g10171, partial [Tetraparma gracilis]
NYGERLTVALHVYSEQREDRLVIDTMRDEFNAFGAHAISSMSSRISSQSLSRTLESHSRASKLSKQTFSHLNENAVRRKSKELKKMKV